MISDDKAKEIMKNTLSVNDCIERIKEVASIERVYSGAGISEYVLQLESSILHHYMYGAFPGCIILSRTIVERALKEELSKKGYPDICLERLNLEYIIKGAENEGIISKDSAKKADEIRIKGNKYVHAKPEIAKGKKVSISMIARSPTRIEDWISTMEFMDNRKPDAIKSFEDVVYILSEIYSEKNYPIG